MAPVAVAVPIAADRAEECSAATSAVDGPVRAENWARLARDGTRRGLEKDWTVRARVLRLLDGGEIKSVEQIKTGANIRSRRSADLLLFSFRALMR
jgi:hypothetical protein